MIRNWVVPKICRVSFLREQRIGRELSFCLIEYSQVEFSVSQPSLCFISSKVRHNPNTRYRLYRNQF